MSTPLNLKSGGGSYGTNAAGGASSAASNGDPHNDQYIGQSTTTTTRQRRNASDYGPFSSPHGSFDEPPHHAFPPYAELPFTALKRRRQLQEGNSFVKWAMRGVLLSPLVVLVLWSVVALVFAHPHQVGNSASGGGSSSSSNKQSRRGLKRGTASQAVQQSMVYMQPNVMGQQQQQQQQQQQIMQQQQLEQGGVIYTYANNGVNPTMMMVMPQQPQQRRTQQLMTSGSGQVPDQYFMASASGAIANPGQYMATASGAVGAPVYMTQQQQEQEPQQLQMLSDQGNSIPALAPLGGTSASMGLQQQEVMQQQQQLLQTPEVPLMAPQSMSNTPGYLAVRQGQGGLQAANHRPAVVHRPSPRATLDAIQQQAVAAVQPYLGAAAPGDDPLGGPGAEAVQASAMQQPLVDGTTTAGSEQLASPTKQAVYYYDPKDTKLGKNGELLSLPTVVYNIHGQAIPLSELRTAPIYVQPPRRGSTTSSQNDSLNAASPLAGSDLDGIGSTLTLEAVPPLEAVNIPQWGSSTSQDQTIIVATVAVMALLVGALSARRLRSKSFLASCIENETLEDDMAYDSAYTTTAAGATGGADSSYNTFGGWRGDLEKFDV